MNGNLKVSIVVVLYNNSAFIHELLSSLQKQSFSDYEVILIDNNSQDDTEVTVEKVVNELAFANAINYEKLSTNTGFSFANNYAVKKAKGDYCLFMNSDVALDKDALQNMVAAISRTHNEGKCIGVAPKMYLTKFLPDKVFDSVGICVNYECSPYNRGIGQFDFGQYDTVDRIMGCCFGCALIDREVFLKLGGLDEDYFAYFEDVDWCIRARKSGYEFYTCPQAVAYHHHSASSSKNSYAWKYKLIFSNYLKTATKSLGRNCAWKIVLLKLRDLTKELVFGKEVWLKKAIAEIILQYITADLWKSISKRNQVQQYYKKHVVDEAIFSFSQGEPSHFFDPVHYRPINVNSQKEYLQNRIKLSKEQEGRLKAYYSQ